MDEHSDNSYQEEVYLATYAIARESKGKRGYHFSFDGQDLLLTPFAYLNGCMKEFRVLRVTSRDILGGDQTFVDELEKMLGYDDFALQF